MKMGQAWLMSVIPAIHEAQIRWIEVKGQTGQKFHMTPISTNKLSSIIQRYGRYN
jgi:hypothetical protein